MFVATGCDSLLDAFIVSIPDELVTYQTDVTHEPNTLGAPNATVNQPRRNTEPTTHNPKTHARQQRGPQHPRRRLEIPSHDVRSWRRRVSLIHACFVPVRVVRVSRRLSAGFVEPPYSSYRGSGRGGVSDFGGVCLLSLWTQANTTRLSVGEGSCTVQDRQSIQTADQNRRCCRVPRFCGCVLFFLGGGSL